MMKLSICFEGGNDTTEQIVDQQIVVNHFRARSVAFEQARKGLTHSPGTVIIVPHAGQICCKANEELQIVPAGVALLLDGNGDNTLVEAIGENGGAAMEGSLGIIEISATISASFRLRDQLELPGRLDSHESKRITDIFNSLFPSRQAVQLSPDSEDISLHLFAAQIVSLIRASAQQPIASQENSKQQTELTRLRQFILANLGKSISTTDMADHLGLSRARFSVKAKSQLGVSPANYLRRVRMERSLELLQHTTDSIDEIAYQVGYADRYQFSKVFTKIYGYSPVQYRKRCISGKHTELYNEARSMFDRRCYRQAAGICENALSRPGSNPNADQLLYLHGQCLSGLGETERALAVWEQIQEDLYKWQAAVQRCKLHFQSDHYSDALSELEGLWEAAEGTKYNDIIQIWMEQVHGLFAKHKATALRRYLAFRKQHFAADQQSKPLAINACHRLRNTMLMLDHCQVESLTHNRALAFSGEFEQAIALHRDIKDPALLNYSLLRSGNYEEVLRTDPEIPEQCVVALTALGRPKEAIKRFPDHCAVAYLKLKQYRKVLDFNTNSFERIYALHALGETEALEQYDIEGTWLWHMAQLYVRPEVLLEVDYPETHLFIPRVRLLLALREDNTTEEILNHVGAIPHIDTDDIWPHPFDYTIILLRHSIPVLLGQQRDLSSELRVMVEEWRYINHQMLYYDARYLAKDITAADWREQPYQLDIDSRWSFIQALKHDLSGRTERARQNYHEFINHLPIYEADTLLRHRFAEWRLRVLGT